MMNREPIYVEPSALTKTAPEHTVRHSAQSAANNFATRTLAE